MKSSLPSGSTTPAIVKKSSIPPILLVLALAWWPAFVTVARAQNASPGVIQFADAPSGYELINGNVNFKISRAGGTAGAVSATCTTQDGTAKAGVDYTATTKVISWASGDVADKAFLVPFINRNLNDGTTVTFTAVLSNPTGGATLGTNTTGIETIQYPGASTQPSVNITSPPAGIALVTGTPVTLAASVNDPAGTLSKVLFYLDHVLVGQTGSAGPYLFKTIAPAAGTYLLEAAAVDNSGGQILSSRTVTVLPVDPADPVPATEAYGDLGGRQLAGGTTIVLSAMAASLSPDGTPLAKVAFYADDTLIAAYDGSGNLLGGANGSDAGNRGRRPAGQSTRRPAEAVSGAGTPVGQGTVFMASWGMPDLTKLINLLIVATTEGGRSQVTAPVTVQVVASAAGSDRPPVAVFADVFGGSRVRTGVEVDIPVDVSDPDSGGTSGRIGGGRRPNAVGAASGVVSKMEFYLNAAKMGTATQSPFSFNFTPPSDGTYVIQAIATDAAGLAGVAVPVVVAARSASPGVTLSVAGKGGNKSVVVGGTSKVKVVATRTGDDLSLPLTVAYKARGTAIPGEDYKVLSGQVPFPPARSALRSRCVPLTTERRTARPSSNSSSRPAQTRFTRTANLPA